MAGLVRSECSPSVTGLQIPLPTYYRSAAGGCKVDPSSASMSTSASSGVLSCFDPFAANANLGDKPHTVMKKLELPDAVAAAFKDLQGNQSQVVGLEQEERLPTGICKADHERFMQLVRESTSKLCAQNALGSCSSYEDPFAELEA